MRRTIPLALIACLALAGCSESADDTARDCAAALTSRTGGDPADKPTVSQAEARVDAFDDTLADMVRQGHREIAEEAADTVTGKSEEAGGTRPKACEPLSEDEFTVLVMAKTISGLGWTDEEGQFNKLKMAERLGD